MTKEQFAMWAAALQTYYPKENLLPNKQALGLWYAQLQDIPYEVAQTALNRWVATEKWSPTIADMRSQAAEIIYGSAGDWGDGWKQVLSAIGRFGQYRVQEALESMDEITRECVERLGFVELCRGENLAVDRANFRTLYEAISERKNKDRQTPESIMLRIGQIQQKRLAGE